jgi:hypothetical protein
MKHGFEIISAINGFRKLKQIIAGTNEKAVVAERANENARIKN